MAERAVHVLVFEGFADWEPAHALAALRRWGKRRVVSVGFDAAPALSMGGLRVLSKISLADVQEPDVEILILPGGDAWEHEYPERALNEMLWGLVASNVPVAAICAGTLAVARAGLLDDRRHTSNAPEYLTEHVPEYGGAASYVDAPAVNDRGLITASGLAPVEFAREIFRELRIFNAADEESWFEMFKNGRLPGSAV